MTKSVSQIIRIAKTVREIVTRDGETFYFAPVGCDDDQIEALSLKGFHLCADPNHDRGTGLCWSR